MTESLPCLPSVCLPVQTVYDCAVICMLYPAIHTTEPLAIFWRGAGSGRPAL